MVPELQLETSPSQLHKVQDSLALGHAEFCGDEAKGCLPKFDMDGSCQPGFSPDLCLSWTVH